MVHSQTTKKKLFFHIQTADHRFEQNKIKHLHFIYKLQQVGILTVSSDRSGELTSYLQISNQLSENRFKMKVVMGEMMPIFHNSVMETIASAFIWQVLQQHQSQKLNKAQEADKGGWLSSGEGLGATRDDCAKIQHEMKNSTFDPEQMLRQRCNK